MSKKVAFIFPGQGAQTVGMGKEFFEAFSEAKEVFEEADSILNRPLSKVIFEGPEELLIETRNSQSGIFVTSIALLRVLEKQFPELIPQVTSGLSLGEYSALVASKRVLFHEALPVVEFRGQVMNEACLEHPGKMAVILGLTADVVEELVKIVNLPNDLWAANFNCPGQTVISGTALGIEEGTKAALNKGTKRVIPLKVHGAFHSGLMKSAESRLKEKIEALHLKDSTIGFVMNVPGNFETNNERIRQNLISQVTSPVRWEQGIKAMDPEIDLYIEIGCGKTLAGLNKQIGVKGQTITINKVQDLEQVAAHL